MKNIGVGGMCNIDKNGDEILSSILNLISIWLQVKNLYLNEEQIKYLDEHLNKQDNDYLQKIYEQNERIISLLEKLGNGRI